jgi:hypothetical protein
MKRLCHLNDFPALSGSYSGRILSQRVTFLKGSRVGGMLWMLPRFNMKPLFHSMEKSPEWDENTKLIFTVADELRLAQQLVPESISEYNQK